MKNYAVYASGKCTRIKKAVEKYPIISNQIKCIVTDEKEDVEVKEYFEDKNIRYYNFEYSTYPKESDRNLMLSNYILNILKKYNIDYCFSFGGHILKGDILNIYSYRLINFHPGIIPDVIGLHAIDKALLDNKRFIGNTVHFIDSGIDSGPIIMQNLMLAENFEKYGYDIFLDQQIELLMKTIQLLEDDRIRVVDNNVTIADADYTISHIFPRFE